MKLTSISDKFVSPSIIDSNLVNLAKHAKISFFWKAMKAQKSTSTDHTSKHNCAISVVDVFLDLKMKPDFSIVCLKTRLTPTVANFERNKNESLLGIKIC